MATDGNDQLNVQNTNIQAVPFDSAQQQVNIVSQTFRSPLPPTHGRPQRLPFQIAQQMLIRQKIPQVCLINIYCWFWLLGKIVVYAYFCFSK